MSLEDKKLNDGDKDNKDNKMGMEMLCKRNIFFVLTAWKGKVEYLRRLSV